MPTFGLNAWFHAISCVSKPLHAADLDDNPFHQLTAWMDKAKRAGLPEPNAMSVSTVSEEGQPSQRMVLLKKMSEERGLYFFTNYGSRKARELAVNPRTSLLIHYHILQRQIRITGRAERADREESEAYFSTRARSSQLGAWASRQSEVLDSRDTFESRYAEVEQRFKGKEVPCPDFWGGIRVVPENFEFWQGRAHRLHDRFRYSRSGAGWERIRLYP